MYASATIGYASQDIAATRRVVRRGEASTGPTTIRVRKGRTTARRAAINASWGYGR